MATLFNKTPKDTYQQLLKLSGNDGLTTSLQAVEDGVGNSTPLSLSSTQISLNGIVWPTTTPTANQVLSYNGTGLTWSTPSTGSNSNFDSVTYTYNEDGNVDTVTEVYGSDTRTVVFTYNPDNTVNTTTATFQGVTRVETYGYDTSGNVTSIVASNP